MNHELHLAELLCARLCHDLSGPFGALLGVLEIARDEQPGSETLVVAEQTAAELTQKLKLLRAAWGQDAEELDLARLHGLAGGLSSSRPVRVDLTGMLPSVRFPPPAARVVLNLLLLAAESLPRGGVVALTGSPAGGILATISGPRAAWPAGLAGWLADPTAALAALLTTPRGMQAPLTALLVRDQGFRLSMLMPTAVRTSGALVPPLLLSFQDR
jgi:histidine phosphotransferase ChpT